MRDLEDTSGFRTAQSSLAHSPHRTHMKVQDEYRQDYHNKVSRVYSVPTCSLQKHSIFMCYDPVMWNSDLQHGEKLSRFPNQKAELFCAFPKLTGLLGRQPKASHYI